MRKIYFNTAAAICILSLFAILSCKKVTPKDPVFPTKAKTILFYFASNNNLSTDAAANIKKIINGYVPSDGNLLLYCNNFNLETYAMKDTLPLLVNVYKDEGGKVCADTIYRFAYMNSCTKNAMTSVLKIAKTMTPANEWAMVLWSHGTGWLPVGYYSTVETTDEAPMQNGAVRRPYPWAPAPGGVDPYAHLVKSFGEEKNVEMSIFDIEEAIKAADMHFNFIAFDACLMGDIEVAYQLRNYCDYFIASAAEILTDGYPYSTVVEKMCAFDYNGIAKNIYDYYNAQSGDFHSVTIATVKTSELPAVAAAAKKLFAAHRGEIASLDLSKIQRYFRYDRHWFWDLNDYLVNLCGAEETAAFTAALEKAVTAKYTTGQIIDLVIDPAKFSGLGTYIPKPANTTLDTYYLKYDWNTAVEMILPAASE